MSAMVIIFFAAAYLNERTFLAHTPDNKINYLHSREPQRGTNPTPQRTIR